MKFYRLMALGEAKTNPYWLEADGEPIKVAGFDMFLENFEYKKKKYIGITDAETGMFVIGGCAKWWDIDELIEQAKYHIDNDRGAVEKRRTEVIKMYGKSPLYDSKPKLPVKLPVKEGEQDA